ncbi:MAG: TolC family protein [Sphingobacteriales bacterium]|nr:TolC family protein [Sphingobacteriales bacterium]
MLTLIALSLSKAEAQEKLSLDSLIQVIKRDNPELKVFDEQVKSENAKIEGASAWMAPNVGLGTFMTPYNNFSRPGSQQDGSLMFTAEQKIPNASNLKAQKEFLSAQAAVTLQSRAENFNQLRAIARSVYLDVLVLNQELNYDRQNLVILQNLKKLAEIRYTYNQADLAQIYQMDAKIYQLANKISNTKSNINVGKIKLNTLMNKPQQSVLELDSTFDESAIFKTESELAVSQNRSIAKQYDAKITSLSLENKLIASTAKPEFNIQFNHMITYNTSMPNQFSLIAGISIPFAPWAAKSYQSKLKVNAFEQDAILQEKQSFINNNIGLIKTQEERLGNLKTERAVYQKNIIPALQKSYEANLLNYQENKADLKTVLDAWKDLNDGELAYLELLNNYYQTLADYGKNVER